MKREKIPAMLAEVLEKDVSGPVDLWPGIRAQAGAPDGKARRAPRLAWASGIALVMLLSAAGVAIALSVAEKAAQGDDGANAVYKAGMITQVGQTQTLDGVNVTLDWVYADPLRVLVAYSTTAPGREDFRPDTSLSSETLLNGVAPGRMGGVGYVETNTNMSEIAALITPDLPEGAGSLDAQLALKVSDASALLHVTDMPPGSPDDPGAKQAQLALIKDIGTLHFDVQIPVTAGQTFTPGQDADAAGITVHLKRLIVAPSGVRADVCFDPPADGYEWTVAGEVLAGGKSTENGVSIGSKGIDADGCYTAVYWAPLPLDAGSYTVRITEIIGFPTANPADPQNRIKGPWVFEVSGQ